MTEYKLNIKLKDDDIDHIKKLDYNITIVKEINEANYDIAWVLIKPENLYNDISINWEENYQIFATTEAVDEGVIIKYASYKESNLKIEWDFDGTFKKVERGNAKPNTITIYDKKSGIKGIGLQQKVKTNSNEFKPLGVINSDNNITIDLKPKLKVYIFISKAKELQALSIKARGQYTLLDYSNLNELTVNFNKNTNKFEIIDRVNLNFFHL